MDHEDPHYEKRLASQHGMVLGLGALPVGAIGGLFFGIPMARTVVGFPQGILTTGLVSVLLSLGIGLLLLSMGQGAWRLIRDFWNLRLSMEELPGEQRLVWYTFVMALLFLGLGLGYSVAFLIA